MEIKAYDIAEEVIEIILDDEKKDNINKIFLQILGEGGERKKHLSVSCCIIEDNKNEFNVLYNYYINREANFNYSIFANKLLESEKTKSGKARKQSIQEGFLFIKSEKTALYLMKLEKIKDVDSKTFEIKKALGTDNNYYKLCVLENDLNNITVVDKNTRLASYWFEGFLGLTRNRDEHQNTGELIDLIRNKKLFVESVIDVEKIDELYKTTEEFIFKNEIFDKNKLIEYLVEKKIIDNVAVEKVYSSESTKIDAEFNISEKEMLKRYRKTINISNDTKITTNNLVKLKNTQGIILQDDQIILTVASDFIESVKRELEFNDN